MRVVARGERAHDVGVVAGRVRGVRGVRGVGRAGRGREAVEGLEVGARGAGRARQSQRHGQQLRHHAVVRHQRRQ